MEEKLRDFSALTVDPRDFDDKVTSGAADFLIKLLGTLNYSETLPTTVNYPETKCWLQTIVLTQIDALRKELLTAAKESVPHLGISKVWRPLL